MGERTLREVQAETGHTPLTALLSVRCSPELRERIDQAAADCAMTPGSWLRAVIESGVELHEAADGEPETDEDDGDQGSDETVEEYAQRVREAAAEERSRIDADARLRARRVPTEDTADKPEHISPRDCPHLPRDRRGNRCSRCRAVIGGRMPRRIGR